MRNRVLSESQKTFWNKSSTSHAIWTFHLAHNVTPIELTECEQSDLNILHAFRSLNDANEFKLFSKTIRFNHDRSSGRGIRNQLPASLSYNRSSNGIDPTRYVLSFLYSRIGRYRRDPWLIAMFYVLNTESIDTKQSHPNIHMKRFRAW